MKEKHRKIVFLVIALCALVILLLFLWTFQLSTQRQSPVLLWSTDNAIRAGSAVSLIELTTGKTQGLSLRAHGCDGFAQDTKGSVHIACRIGPDAFSSYNVKKNIFMKELIPFSLHETFRAPLTCEDAGACYYGFGVINVNGDSGAHIVKMQDHVVIQTIPLPTHSKNHVPVRMTVSGHTLFVLDRGPSAQRSYIHTYDTERREFDGEPIDVGTNAWDFAINDQFVAVSVYRPIAQKDILLINRATHTIQASLLVEGNEPTFNALGLAIRGDILYVAGTNGVSMYNIYTKERIAFYPTPDFALNVVYGNNHIYATIPNVDEIVELDPDTLAHARTFKAPIGFGGIMVVE